MSQASSSGQHIALLRAVNLGPHNQVSMAALKSMLEALGLREPRSLLQSGNLLFESSGKSPAQLETLLEAAAKERLGLDTPFFVRTTQEWQAIIAGNPFPAEAKADPGHLVAVSLKESPPAKAVTALQAAAASKGREQIRAVGRTLYVTYPDGIGRSKLTAAVVAKHLTTPGTARNWNTVLKLGALLGDAPVAQKKSLARSP